MKQNIMLKDSITSLEYNQAMLFYTNKADAGTTVLEILENSKLTMIEFLNKIPDAKIEYSYSFGKWTVAEVLQHIITYENIMLERALVIAGVQKESLQFSYYTQAWTAKGGKEKDKSELVSDF